MAKDNIFHFYDLLKTGQGLLGYRGLEVRQLAIEVVKLVLEQYEEFLTEGEKHDVLKQNTVLPALSSRLIKMHSENDDEIRQIVADTIYTVS